MANDVTETLDVPCAGGVWRIVDAKKKLLIRGRLPGAYNYDRTAETLRVAQQAGVPPAMLLAPAMPGSWMVNNRASSAVLKGWLCKDSAPLWSALLRHLSEGPEEWLAVNDDARREVSAAVAGLTRDAHSTCAISKVLALLCPDTVPLMDDAALAFMTGGAADPDTAENPSAGPEAFVPMLDAFAEAVMKGERALLALASSYSLARLSPSQTLDRLLWFDTWGRRIVKPTWTLEETDGVRSVVPSTA